jgi:hypothetical protein
MTTITPMIRARVDGISGLAATGHTGQQSKMGDQSRQPRQLSIHVAQLRRAPSDGQGGERDVANVSGRGDCFAAPVGCAASPYIRDLYGRGDLSC